jgi:hypothetical protein
MRALLQPGDTVVTAFPAYQVSRAFLAGNGARWRHTVAPHTLLCVPPPAAYHQSLYEVASSVGCTLQHWEPRPADTGRLQFNIQEALVSAG